MNKGFENFGRNLVPLLAAGAISCGGEVSSGDTGRNVAGSPESLNAPHLDAVIAGDAKKVNLYIDGVRDRISDVAIIVTPTGEDPIILEVGKFVGSDSSAYQNLVFDHRIYGLDLKAFHADGKEVPITTPAVEGGIKGYSKIEIGDAIVKNIGSAPETPGN